MTNNDESTKEYFNKVTDISKISYEQEMERHKQLLVKSDNLIKYISSVFVVVNVIFPFALKSKIINNRFLLFMYLLISLPLVSSLYFSIKAQKLQDVKFFPTGDKVIELLKTNYDEYGTIEKMCNKIISYYSASIDSLEKCNNYMSIWIKNSNNLYLASLIVVLISMVLLIA